jgi:hypothetical protein
MDGGVQNQNEVDWILAGYDSSSDTTKMVNLCVVISNQSACVFIKSAKSIPSNYTVGVDKNLINTAWSTGDMVAVTTTLAGTGYGISRLDYYVLNHPFNVNFTGYTFDRLTNISKTGLVGAYSIFKLNSFYNGPIVNIRRASDSSSCDFYSDSNGILGMGQLATGITAVEWLTGTTGYITKWYDQSGKGNHATQSTTGSQPSININSKYIDFSGNRYFTLPNGTVPSGNSSYTVTYKHGAIPNDRGGILGSGNYGSSNQVLAFRTNTSTTAYSHYWWVTDFVINGYAANNMVTETYESTTRNRNAYINKNYVNI